jgi:hypothetical protein
MVHRNPMTIKGLPRLPPRSISRSQPVAREQLITGQHAFGNIVTAVYSAILREIGTKGKEARFKKTDRGHFTAAG